MFQDFVPIRILTNYRNKPYGLTQASQIFSYVAGYTSV
jgi:hypothetical protein